MASPADSKVIAYIADISDVKAKIHELIAGAHKVSAAYEKVGQAEIRRLPQDMTNLIGTTTKTSEVIKDANGEFLQLTKTTTVFGRELKKGVVTPFSKTVTSVNNASQSVNSFSKSTSSLMGKTSQLATSFNDINNINQKFAGRLQNVGFATNVVSKNINETSGNIQRMGAIVQTSDGKFVQLQETITKTPTGIQNVSRSVKDVSSSFKEAKINTVGLMGKTSQLATSFNDINNINQKFAGRLQNVGFATNVVSKNINETSGNIQRMGAIVQTSDGKFVQLQETITKTPTGIQNVSRSVKDVSSSFKEAKINTVGLGDNILRLAKRAALTIPLWLVLRGTVMGVISTFKNGIEAIRTQDEAFQKVKRTISGSTEEISKNFDTLKESVLALSIETGESVEKITSAFYKFSTVGFSFEDSMKGAEYATKTAIAMFGDAEETANVFARAMRVLVDNSEGAASSGEQIGEAMALTAELWKNNAFELGEFTQSLEKFAGTAKATNFTTKQTIALLASLSTAGLRGGRAGTLLRTSIVKLLSNLDKLSSTLGVKVNPQLDTTYDVFMRVLEAIHGLDEGSKIAAQTADAIGEIFGGVRGMEAILGLKALREELLKNTQAVVGIDKLNESFENVSETTSRLMKQLQNLNREIGRSLVQEILGGAERQNQILSNLVNYMQAFTTETDAGISRMEGLGTAIETLGRTAAFLPSLIAPLLTGGRIGFIDPFAALTNLNIRQFSRTAKQVNQFADDIVAGLQGKLSKAKLEELLTDFQIKITKNNLELTPDATTQLEEQLRNQLQTAVDTVSSQVNPAYFQALSPEQQQDISKLILDTEMARLEVIGATNSQMLQATNILIDRLGIEEETIDKISRQLELERSLSEERRLQSELGNESIKLFKIAQTQGVDVAKQIGDVLSGTTSFDTFMRIGGEAAEIFKSEFADVFEQQQAKRFFQGLTIPGLEDLRGGYGINIQEEAIRQRGFTAVPAQLMQERAERQFQQIQRDIALTAPVTMNIKVDISKLPELEQEFLAKVSAELPRVGTELNSALQTAMKNTLVGKQSPTV